MRTPTWLLLAAVTASISLPFSSPVITAAGAQNRYPSQPIHIILPNPPGGYYDRVTRVLGAYISQALGQPVVVENKTGGSGTIGAIQVARSSPNGYTLIVGSSGTFGIAPAMKTKLPYDPVKDFAPIALTTTLPSLLLVRSNSPYKTAGELVAATQGKSMPTLYASNGIGSSSHLTMELFRMASGASLASVPYAGSAPAMIALANGEIEVAFGNVQDALPFIKGGRVRALGVAGASRLDVMPDVPTLAEAGYPKVLASSWLGFSAPAGTSPTIINQLNAVINKALLDPEVRKKLDPSGEVEILGGTSVQYREFLNAEIARWNSVVRAGNIQKN
ncbi:MAG: tripartite tricarboxylate transporter substrate binding protein [Polaromonas sp.]|uniref:Bug family tripartite tricarboxylate transporter substrate binding protein n=1 Tax=Polaromonas sp. TaxID=1869339 RepID=UPI0025FC033E|nr:tripartite tricarboxylate transporter substrate binding protein [Polaromonas sp.]MBI2726500.1 tripartite tricarboxylate transporter substrate binding protein [Polaromonas sp.]